MNANMSGFDSILNCRLGRAKKGKRILASMDEHMYESKSKSTYILSNGNRVTIEDSDGSPRKLKCSYGIMNVIRLRYVLALKQHYPTGPAHRFLEPPADSVLASSGVVPVECPLW